MLSWFNFVGDGDDNRSTEVFFRGWTFFSNTGLDGPIECLSKVYLQR